MYNPGYVVISLKNFNFGVDELRTVPGIYSEIGSAMNTGKSITIKDFLINNYASAPAPVTIAPYVSTVSGAPRLFFKCYTSHAEFSVSEDDALTIITHDN